MALEVFAALFHFDEHDGFPDVIRKGNAAAILIGFADAELGLPAYVERAGLAKGLKEPVEEDLRLTLLVAGDVFGASRGEFGEFFPARHGGALAEVAAGGYARVAPVEAHSRRMDHAIDAARNESRMDIRLRRTVVYPLDRFTGAGNDGIGTPPVFQIVRVLNQVRAIQVRVEPETEGAIRQPAGGAICEKDGGAAQRLQ